MSNTVSLSPMTRIEGHLAIHTDVEPLGNAADAGCRVTAARCEGEMYRGFEQILRGRDPMDAQQITQRICGVCPISHGMASVCAQEMAYQLTPSRNGRLLRNLILAANFLQSHILHFYHLAALDFVDVTAILNYGGSDRTLKSLKGWVQAALARQESFAAAPFLPRFEGKYVQNDDRNVALLSHYIEALHIRRTCHEMAAVFGARLPHSTALVPGGVTQSATTERVLAYVSRLREVHSFVDEVYIPDILTVAAEFGDYTEVGRGTGNFLCYGAFEMNEQGARWIPPGVVIDGQWQTVDSRQISEDVACSRYVQTPRRHPARGVTKPEPRRDGAYSWIKAPRYGGHPMEVGPLARVMTAYLNPRETWVKREVDGFLQKAQLSVDKLVSVLGRHAARALECDWITRQAFDWLDEIEIDAPTSVDFDLPEEASGYGLVEAPRGALGHWLSIADYRISHYQCVVPTTWNCSPRDAQGNPGPVEEALRGTHIANPEQPIEVGRVVRSFDPCLACAVH